MLLRFYTPLQQILQPTGQAIDIVDPTRAPLDQYKLLVAPSLNVISSELAAKLVAYVKAGGHLLLGPRSGMKDEYNALNPQRQPGPLADALGGRVEQYYALDKPAALAPQQSAVPSASADIWAEALSPSSPDTKVVLRYNDKTGWLADHPAMITRQLGTGSISYLGTLPDATLMHALLTSAAHQAHVETAATELPPGVELCERTSGARHVFILINHNQTANTVTLKGSYEDLLPGASLAVAQSTTRISLPPQGIAILTPRTP